MDTSSKRKPDIGVYDHLKVEPKWQKRWAKDKAGIATEDPDRQKFYALIEFPYPSGDGLHVGHIRSNTAMDVIARKRRREGYNVLYPIGWDAFGLPTENYAIKTGIQPAIVTKRNTDTFRRQLKALGFSFDWSREVDTTDPAYYRWTQWIFLQLLKNGLAYKKRMSINWCPKDLIGLANEEVVNGCCERCGTPVEKKDKEQWMLAITKYADRLDKDLDTVDFLEKIKIQQRNWIGRSEGAEIRFEIKNAKSETNLNKSEITVYTTRPDTLFGVLAPEHPLVATLIPAIQNRDEAVDYISKAKSESDIERTDATKEKTGVALKGVTAINPANGQEVPVWISDYVLADYGTGAVMAVPAHDERDWAFAQKFSLAIKRVISSGVANDLDKPFVEYGMLVDSGAFTGKKSEEVMKDIAKAVGGTWITKYKLRDWIFSRQRYWGEPIPVVHCKACAVSANRGNIAAAINFYHKPIWQEIKDGQKSIETRALNPEEKDRYFGDIKPGDLVLFQYKDKKGGIKDQLVARIRSKRVHHSLADAYADESLVAHVRSEKFDTFEDFRESYSFTPDYIARIEKNGLVAWEFDIVSHAVPVPENKLPVKLPKVKNYAPTATGESPLAAIDSWVNVKCPVCKGPAKRETDTMPNWAGSSWYYLRYADARNKKAFADPAKLAYWTPVDWYNGGMEHTTLHLLYSRFWHKFLYDLKLVPTSEPYQKRTSHGLILAEGGEKMSKSKGNVVNPDALVKAVGADALRVYEMFMGPFDQPIAWDTQNIAGSRRFLERVWKLRAKVAVGTSAGDRAVHKAIKKVTDDIEAMRFNTAISTLMIAVNELEGQESVSMRQYESVLQLLAPFAPHIAEELWASCGHKASVHASPWPAYDAGLAEDSQTTVVVQVNGKMRASFQAGKDASKNELESAAMALPEVQKWLAGGSVVKTVVVPGKLVNFVLKTGP